MALRSSSSVLLVSTLLSSLACSAGGSGTGAEVGSGNGGSAGTNIIVNPVAGAGSGLTIGGSTGETEVDPNDPRPVPVRKKVCDAAGMNCTCLRLAMLGTLTSAAADSDTAAFVAWLNGNSGGTATLTNVATKPTVDATFLSNYDILLVANVNTWTFSADEKAAVQKWVSESGGGIITITGFESTAGEPAASSQLISFSGISYAGGTLSQATAPASGEASPVYYKSGSADLKKCLEWNGGSTNHSSPRITTPIKFSPQADKMEKLTLGLDYVGAFIGWPITAPAGATVIAKDPMSGGNMAVALEYNGAGRIFAFGDEWVVFSNEWVPPLNSQPSNKQQDQYNPCWVPAAGNAAGFFHSVETLYQTKQFWYDAINWVAPPNECNFVVNDPDVIVK